MAQPHSGQETALGHECQEAGITDGYLGILPIILSNFIRHQMASGTKMVPDCSVDPHVQVMWESGLFAVVNKLLQGRKGLFGESTR